MKAVIWWLIYTIFGIWLQRFIPGLDCFAPALAGCLYLGLTTTTFWLALFWILIQEGIGSLAFGSTLLFYGGITVFFFWSKIIFTKNSPLFFIGASIFTSGFYLLVMYVMSNLQELDIPINIFLQNALLILIFFPILLSIVILSYSQWIIEPNV